MARKLRMDFFEDSRFPLHLMRLEAQREHGAHAHEFTELVMILGGEGVHFTATEAYPIGAGDVFVIAPDEEHGYRDMRGVTLVNVLFDLAGLRLPEADIRAIPGYHALFLLEPAYRRRHRFTSRLRLREEEAARAAERIARMEGEFRKRVPGYRFACLAQFMDLIAYLCRCYSHTPAPHARPLLGLGRVLGYLERNYAAPLALEELAAMAHMSQSSLQRAFRQVLGRSPIDHLIRLRLERACDLLRRDGMRITEVAHAVGFEDSNYFSRRFRKAYGESPRAWRARHGAR